MIGKKIRMERIMNRETWKTVIVPLDHGVTIGPVAGLINLQETVNAVANRGANAFVVHKEVERARVERRPLVLVEAEESGHTVSVIL